MSSYTGYTLAGAMVVAAGSYAWGMNAWWVVGLVTAAPAAVLPGVRFLAGAASGALTASASEDPAARAAQMSGTEFEDYVARLARGCGLPVIMTPYSGDWGVDLIVGNRPHRIAIQCKRQGRPVGPSAVQQVVAGAPMQDCAHTMVVSNQEFTQAAQQLAELHGCRLVGGSRLPYLRSAIRECALSDPPAAPNVVRAWARAPARDRPRIGRGSPPTADEYPAAPPSPEGSSPYMRRPCRRPHPGADP